MGEHNIRDMRFDSVPRGLKHHGRNGADVTVETRAREIAEHGPLMNHVGDPCGPNKVIARDGFPRRVKRRRYAWSK